MIGEKSIFRPDNPLSGGIPRKTEALVSAFNKSQVLVREHEITLDKIKLISPKYLLYLYTFNENTSLRAEIEKLLMLTYKNYFESMELLQLIIDIYFIPCPSKFNPEQEKFWVHDSQKKFRLLIWNLLRTWLKQRVDDFYTQEMLEIL
jgi:hypothetical protein